MNTSDGQIYAAVSRRANPQEYNATINALVKQIEQGYPAYVYSYPKQAGVNHMLAFFDSWKQ